MVNPIAGTSKKDKIIAYIKKRLQTENLYYEILPTSKDRDYKNVSDKIVSEKITDVVIIGGDGTVNNVIAALLQHDVRFGIIPVGSGNGLARSAGIPMNYKKAFERILSNNPQSIDTFTVNGEFACMLAGIGLDAQIAHDFDGSGSRGLLTYIKKTFAAFIKAKPFAYQMKADRIKLSGEAFFISIANANQFGNNFKIAPFAKLNDGLLDIVIVPKMNKLKLIFSIFKQITEKNKLASPIATANIKYFQINRLVVKNVQNVPIHIDGEPVLLTGNEIAAAINSKKIKLFK